MTRNNGTQAEGTYQVPCKFYPGYSVGYFIIQIFPVVMLSLFSLTLSIEMTWFKFLLVIAAALLLVNPIHGQALKKQYFELTDEYIKQKTLFKEEVYMWQDVVSVKVERIYKGGHFIKIGVKDRTGKSSHSRMMWINIRKYSNLSLMKITNTIAKMGHLGIQ